MNDSEKTYNFHKVFDQNETQESIIDGLSNEVYENCRSNSKE